MKLSTLCYLRFENKVLFLYRNGKKENDVNLGKYIGVGGKFLPGETPRQCVQRECLEETGIEVLSPKFRGMLTFVYGDNEAEYIWVYTAEVETDKVKECTEGELVWVDQDKISKLSLWEGDRIFLSKLFSEEETFDIGLVYDQEDHLIQVY